MTMLTPPALDPNGVEEKRGSLYPEPFKSRMGDRAKRRLGQLAGWPGGQSALRHWHTLEEEFVYVLEGEVVLVTNQGEQTLRAGQCAGYPAASRDGHHFINRAAKPARYLEIGTNVEGDQAFYPDDDLMWIETENGMIAAHKDGRRY